LFRLGGSRVAVSLASGYVFLGHLDGLNPPVMQPEDSVGPDGQVAHVCRELKTRQKSRCMLGLGGKRLGMGRREVLTEKADGLSIKASWMSDTDRQIGWD